MGILINTGFDVGSSSPIDSRTVKNTTDERDALVSDGLVYENLKVYCKDTQKEYRWTGTEWEISSSSSSGTDISMTDYYTKTEVDNDFLKKTDAASTYATKTELNEKANDDEVAKKADITDLQEQIDNLDIPEDVDLSEINDKLTELENNQIKKSYITRLATSGTGYFKIKPCGQNTFSKILITDVYGGCILITGSLMNDNSTYSFKVVRLSNGSWVNSLPSNNTLNKILNVYNDGSYIYLTVASYVNLYIEGGYTNIETIDSVPTEATELPILDLTQQTDLTDINTKLAQLETKRVYNSLEELNTAKGLSISFTNGEDNTMKIVDALSPIETFADYFANSINNNRFGIDTNTYGTDISLLAITKFNDNLTIIRAYMSNGKLLIRRYQNGVLQDWSYDKGNSSELTNINTKLTQLETKANLIPIIGDNPTDYDLNNYRENGNYSIGNGSNYANTPEASAGLLTVIRSNSYRLQIYTVVNNNNVYFRKSSDWGSTWSSWVLLNNSSGASGNGTNNDVYSTEEQAVGTWINGQTLYRRTISDRTERNPSNGTLSTDILALSTPRECEVVKLEGVARIAPNSSTTGAYSVVILPYYEPTNSMRIYLSYISSSGKIGLICTKMSEYKLLGLDVSIYYYKK